MSISHDAVEFVQKFRDGAIVLYYIPTSGLLSEMTNYNMSQKIFAFADKSQEDCYIFQANRNCKRLFLEIVKDFSELKEEVEKMNLMKFYNRRLELVDRFNDWAATQ